MNFRIKRLIISIIIVVCVFSTMSLRCGNENEVEKYTNSDAIEKVENEIAKNTELAETVSTEETKEEPEEIVEQTKPDEESNEPSIVSLGKFKLTAYCACSKCCGKSDGITATGTVATKGRTIAVDPKAIPYGTKVIINGHTYVAEDCGGAIKSNRIDVFYDSHQEALEFGVRHYEVFIVVE